MEGSSIVYKIFNVRLKKRRLLKIVDTFFQAGGKALLTFALMRINHKF